MIKISPAVKISLGLMFISLSVLMFGNFTKLIPDKSTVSMEKRKYAAESLAVQFTMSTHQKDLVAIRKNMDIIKEMYPEVLSLGLRGTNGRILAQTQDHKTEWVAPPDEESTVTHWQVPIYQGKRHHSTLEISFAKDMFVLLGYHLSHFAIMIAGFSGITFVFFFLLMRRTMRNMTELEKRNSQLSIMVEQQQLANAEVEHQNRELEILSTQDPLTGCLNRRAFYAKAEQYISKAIAEQSHVSCIITDINRFKPINDDNGHRLGDQVIKYFAKTLNSSTREEDIVCRYGGEEFCILLPDCDIEGAAAFSEQIRLKIETHGARAISEAPGIKVTSSFGVSELNSSTHTVDDMIRQADAALYKAKESGRNRVVVWNEGMIPGKEDDAQEVSSVG